MPDITVDVAVSTTVVEIVTQAGPTVDVATTAAGDGVNVEVVLTEGPEVLIEQQAAAGDVSITVENAGVQGPKGDQGPPGIPATRNVHQQTTPSAVWVIDHNLGYRPSVTVIDTAGSEAVCDVSHPSANQTRLTFSAALAGIANMT